MTRHRFEPSRLLLGLLLSGTAVTYAMEAVGAWRVPLWALLAMVPLSLMAAAFMALATYFVRRTLRRRRALAQPAQGTDAPADGSNEGKERNGGNAGSAERDAQNAAQNAAQRDGS